LFLEKVAEEDYNKVYTIDKNPSVRLKASSSGREPT
jgi:hypothetical protein